MLNLSIRKLFKSMCDGMDMGYVDSFVFSCYVYQRKLKVPDNYNYRHLLLNNDDNLNIFLSALQRHNLEIDLEDAIEMFEYVLSPSEKEINGAVYTPNYIREFIVKESLSRFPVYELKKTKIADIACGCGGFFVSAARFIQAQTGEKVSDIIKNFYGFDIADYSIERTKIILSLMCLEEEDIGEVHDANFLVANSLAYDWFSIEEIKRHGGFDVVVGNPPYVGASKIDGDIRKLLKRWATTSTGKTDLYIPFFEIGLSVLKENGILGYITVNNFYRSLNGRALRQYFATNSFGLKIIDFGNEQIFKGRSTYTCLCFVEKSKGIIQYLKYCSERLDYIRSDLFTRVDYSSLDNHRGWLLNDGSVSENVHKIINIGSSLGASFQIRNGFATLKNDVYLFKSEREDKDLLYFKKNGIEYAIEKVICRRAVKPNTLHTDSDISQSMEYLIFPYHNVDNKMSLIIEKDMQECYPYAYRYLSQCSEVLKSRDKGIREYANWYAFGRTQALNIEGYKLFFPYIADHPRFILCDDRTLLFYNGYAVIGDNIRKLKVLQRILNSSVFWYFIVNTSKPYSGNFFSLSKNHVKHFGIPELTYEQEEYLLNNNKNKVDKYLEDLYGIKV